MAEGPPRRLGPARLVAFALFTTALALGGAELGLRVAGLPAAPDRTNTWFSDHILTPPLWHEREAPDGTVYLSMGQPHHFHPFPKERPEHTVRIAVLGGSAAHGYGMLEPGAFPHRVEQLLQEALPNEQVEVVNLGTVAWSTQQLLWASKQLWQVSDWDLIVIFSGNNELLELSSWKTFKRPAEHRWYTRVLLWNQRLGHLRLFGLLRSLVSSERLDALNQHGAEPAETGLLERLASEGVEVGAEDDQPAESNLQPGQDPLPAIPAKDLDSLQAIPRPERARMGPLELRYAARTYQHNVGRIVRMARAHGTPVVLMNPPPNDFQDPAYFDYPGEEGERFSALLEESQRVFDTGDGSGAITLAEQALALQPADPRAAHQLATMLPPDDPRRLPLLHQARRLAEYPNRVVPDVSEAILAMEGRPGVLGVVDIEAKFRSLSHDGTIGYDLVYDHCHPAVHTNPIIAGEVVKLLMARDLPWMRGAQPVDVDAWAARKRAELEQRQAPNPRLGEWTGMDWDGRYGLGGIYIADFQGQWRQIKEQLTEGLGPESTAMDFVWAGNAHWYDWEAEEAFEAWRIAWNVDPELCLAPANAAHAWANLGNWERAAREAERAVTCGDEASRALLQRMRTLGG